MNLEELTKHQILLLTLLVSFVTSIATGIVTVTLMDQAPPGMTNTINRIVERTVEKVVPAPKGQTASVITKETTVVVKEEDLITSSIDKGTKSLVRVATIPSTPDGVSKTIAIGTLISSNGLVVTDAFQVSTEGKYSIRYGEITYQAEVVAQDEEKGIAILKIVPDPKETQELKFPVISFADMSALKLGQTLIGISGDVKYAIFMGVISGIDTVLIPVVPKADIPKDPTKTETTKIDPIETRKVISRIDSNIKDIMISGSPIMNVFGDMVGMMLITSTDRFIVPSSDIVILVQSINTTEKKAP